MTRMKRRWFRFSLRTLLLIITALCVWLGMQVNAARRQKEVVDAIVKAGGRVGYDYEVTPSFILSTSATQRRLLAHSMAPKYDINPNATPSSPAWLRDRIGADYFHNVISV